MSTETNPGAAPVENQPAGQEAAAATGTGSNDTLLGGDGDGGNPGSVASTTETTAAATGAPESYADFELPTGLTLEAPRLEELKAHFKELGLTQEQAQKAAIREATSSKQSMDAQVAAVTQLRESWVNAARTDAEIGGDGFDQNLAAAKLGLSKFGTPALNEFLRTSGIGSHPEVIRVFTRIGKTLKEDQPTPGSGGVAPQKKDLADRMYATSAT